MKSLKIAFALLVSVLPQDATTISIPRGRGLYTDDDMAQLGLQQVSIKTQGWFGRAFGGISGTGTNSNGWENTKTLKFGDLTPDRRSSSASKAVDASDKYIKGKVISSDRQGNIYKNRSTSTTVHGRHRAQALQRSLPRLPARSGQHEEPVGLYCASTASIWATTA